MFAVATATGGGCLPGVSPSSPLLFRQQEFPAVLRCVAYSRRSSIARRRPATSSMVRVDKSSIISMDRAIWMYFAGTEWRNLETASSSSMVTPWLFSLLMSVYMRREKSSTVSPSMNLRLVYSSFRS